MPRPLSILFPLILLASCAQTPQANSPQSLAGVEWRLVRLKGQEIPVLKAGMEPAYLRLTDEKRVGGSSGCNRIAGEYRQTGNRIEFSPLISTRRACLFGMAEEDAFLKALERARIWKRQGDTLRLYDANDELLMEMKAK
jgi:heat shock protein HslJ